MAYESEKQHYDRDGFVVLRNFLPQDDFAALRENLARYLRDVVPGLPATHAFYLDTARPETLKQLQHMGVDPFFDRCRSHPHWREAAESLIGEAAVADEPEWFNKPPGSDHPTPAHQDNYYFCLQPPNIVTIWLALERVDELNGCLRYVPGSHRLPVRPHQTTRLIGFSQGISDYGDEDRRREVAVMLEPGDAVAHHGNMIHRADGNRSPERGRPAFAMVFRGISCQRDEAAFARYHAAFQKQYQEVTTQ